MNFTQEEKDIWLSFSVDTRKRILSCSANDTSSQQNEHQASSMSSAVRQHAQPRHQSRFRSAGHMTNDLLIDKIALTNNVG